MLPSPQLSEQPVAGMLNIDRIAARASLNTASTGSDFGELLHWCDNFSETLLEIIEQIHNDMAGSPPSPGQADGTELGREQGGSDMQPISAVVDQIYDIVLRLERIARRAAD